MRRYIPLGSYRTDFGRFLPDWGMEMEPLEKRMNRIGTIAGIQAAFGASWGDSGRGSRMRTRFSDTVGFYDESGIGRDAHPAPAIVHPMLEIDDPMAACAVFYHDDAGTVFGSVVLSAGQVAPLSEIVHESGGDWRDAILRSKDDANLDQVFFPEGAVGGTHGKLRPYAVSAEKVDLATLPRIRPRHFSAGMLALAAASLAAFVVTVWTFFSGPGSESAQEAEFEVERIRTEYAGLLVRCRAGLREPWPARPNGRCARKAASGRRNWRGSDSRSPFRAVHTSIATTSSTARIGTNTWRGPPSRRWLTVFRDNTSMDPTGSFSTASNLSKRLRVNTDSVAIQSFQIERLEAT